MNSTYLLTLALILFCCTNSIAQQKEPVDFVPEAYKLNEEFRGDLNNDNIEDHVLIIKDTKEEKVVRNGSGDQVDRNRRGVIIILNGKNGYEKVIENKDCFFSENEDGGVYMPPELSIKIENNNLKFHYSHGRYGYWVYIFKYLESDFKLIGFRSSQNRGPKVLSKTKIDFLNKQRSIYKNLNKHLSVEEEKFEVISEEIEIDGLILLSEIGKFDNLDMTQF